MTGFVRGAHIILRSVIDQDANGTPRHVGHTYPAVVVEDSESVIATFQASGTIGMKRTGRRRDDGRLMLPGGWDGGHAPEAWHGDPVVRVHRTGEEWSVWRWLDQDARWSDHFYVNLEDPWTRFARGFQTTDWVLDLTVTRNPPRVRFKDEDELEWSIDSGLIGDAKAAHIRAAGDRAHSLAEANGWPFDADWDRWLPDPGWQAPVLPPDWASLD